jgi:hypothetical protein
MMRSMVKLMFAIAVLAGSAAANAAPADGREPPGAADNLGWRHLVFWIDPPAYRCGRERVRNSVTCPGVGRGVVPSVAPEIDSRFTAEGVLLLAGGLIVLRARRTPKAQA